jgi:hypothetical protein
MPAWLANAFETFVAVAVHAAGQADALATKLSGPENLKNVNLRKSFELWFILSVTLRTSVKTSAFESQEILKSNFSETHYYNKIFFAHQNSTRFLN